MGDAYIRMKLKDQEASLAMIEADPQLKGLRKVRKEGVEEGVGSRTKRRQMLNKC